MRLDGDKIMVECYFCGSEAQMGPHVYQIRNIEHWGVKACDSCIRSNWDGLLPERNKSLISHLKDRNVAIELNKNGWINWPEGTLLPGDVPWGKR